MATNEESSIIRKVREKATLQFKSMMPAMNNKTLKISPKADSMKNLFGAFGISYLLSNSIILSKRRLFF